MKNYNIAIRADGSAKIGMGHLMRCLSIALALKENERNVLFITKNDQSKAFLEEKGFESVLLTGEYTSMEEEVQERDETQNVEKAVIGELTVMEALEQLKENERSIVNMKVLGEMTFQEIAEALSIPLGTVTWRYQNAMKKLRRYGYE